MPLCYGPSFLISHTPWLAVLRVKALLKLCTLEAKSVSYSIWNGTLAMRNLSLMEVGGAYVSTELLYPTFHIP